MVTLAQAKAALKAAKGVKQDAARALGLSRFQLHRILTGKLVAPAGAETPAERVRSHRLEEEVKTLRRQLREQLDAQAEDKVWAEFVSDIERASKTSRPEWLTAPKRGKGGGDAAVASVAISDGHYGERVDPAEVEHFNEYDAEIAAARMKAVFENTVILSRDYVKGHNIQGISVNLLGDNISGEIHPELTESNERTGPEMVLDVANQLIAGLSLFAEEFGKVDVESVPGNHARTTMKPVYKRRSRRNLDWLIYQIVARHFAGDKRVTFSISDGADLSYRIFGTRYLITHGDQFRGGSGIAGALSPMLLGDHRKRKRAQGIGNPYDVLVFGHWHQLMLGVMGMIANGSIKGFDEYAYLNNFAPEPPQQAFWITTPERGVTIRSPIWCDVKPENRRAA